MHISPRHGLEGLKFLSLTIIAPPAQFLQLAGLTRAVLRPGIGPALIWAVEQAMGGALRGRGRGPWGRGNWERNTGPTRQLSAPRLDFLLKE